MLPKLTVQPFFAWYDLWVGLYVDRKGQVLYFFPIPCFGFRIYFAGEGFIERRMNLPFEEEDKTE